MIRFSLVLLTAFFMSHAFAASDDQEVTEVTPQAGAAVDNPEAIVSRHDLASHMGWGEQQAVFKSPRNFRSSELNDISPESLDDAAQPESNN